jgi:general secretion pathway protein L
MFREFWIWWTERLAELVPERWRRFGSSSEDAMVIAPAGSPVGEVESVIVSLRRNGREMPLGQFGLAGSGLRDLPRPVGNAAVLRLGAADVLCKSVTLPLAAQRDLAQALSFEMDRETPFNSEELFWSHRIAVRDRLRGQLSVRLLLVPRAELATLLDALRAAGIMPKRAEIADGPDRGCYLPLDSDRGRLHGTTGRRLLRWLAPAACIGLALAAAATPFVKQGLALAGLDREISAGRATAVAADRLRKEIDRLSDMIGLIDRERDKAGRPLATLAELTRMLPDDTYLIELQQRQRLTLVGRSAGASRLIGALTGDTPLRNPVFAAPVTRIEGSRPEVFTITAEIVP